MPEPPPGFELPRLQEPTLKEKRAANLIHTGRVKGNVNKLSRDVKNGIIDGAIAHGYDGEGLDGLNGFFRMCAERFPKNYMHLISKLVPLQITGDGVPGAHIAAINIVSIPSDSYLSSADIERIRQQGLIEHQAQPEPIASVEPERIEDPIEPEPVVAAEVEIEIEPVEQGIVVRAPLPPRPQRRPTWG